MIKFPIILLVIVLQVFSFAEEVAFKIDSLEMKIKTAHGYDKMMLILEQSKLYIASDSEKAIQLAEQALTMAIDIGDEQAEVQAIIIIAKAKSRLNDIFTGLQYYKRALKISEKLDYTEGYLAAFKGLGVNHYYLSNFDKALEYYQQGLELAEKLGDVEEIADFLNNSAVVYSVIGKYENGIENFQRALNLIEKTHDSIRIIRMRTNIGSGYFKLEQYDKAIEYFKNSIDIAKKINEIKTLGTVYHNLGQTYFKLNDLPNAYINYRNAIQIANRNNLIALTAIAYKSLGDYYHAKSMNDSALVNFHKSLEIAEKYSSKNIIQGCYEGLSSVYIAKGNYKKAVEILGKRDVVKDSIFNERSQSIIEELEVKYETRRKEKEIELLETKTVVQEKEKTILIGVFIGIVFLVVFILVLFVLINKSLKRRNLLLEKDKEVRSLEIEMKDAKAKEKEAENMRLQEEIVANEEINRLRTEKYREELTRKNRELSTSTLMIVNKNEILNSIRDTLIKESEKSGQETNKVLKVLIKDIERSINVDNDWDKFKVHFEEVHQGFFERLITEYPSLTPNEQKLCAYFRINLDSKEIATVLNISLAALEKRRYRLRKKIGLDPDDNIIEFFQKL